MILTLFAHAKDNAPKHVSLTWEEFAQTLGPNNTHDYTDKESLPAFCPAEYRSGGVRSIKSVVRVHFGVLDLDKITTEQLAGVVACLENLDAILYTTWSHGKGFLETGLWRVRVCVRLTRPIQADEWRSFWPRFNSHFGGISDRQCKDPCRLYFGPFPEPGTAHVSEYILFHGQALDPGILTTQALTVQSAGTDKIGRERLKDLASKWKRAKDNYRSHMGRTLMAVCNGEPFAEPGERDTTLFQLSQDIAKEFPNADPRAIAAHFAQSLQVMGTDAPTPDDVAAKFERAAETIVTEEVETIEQELSNRKLRIREAFAHTAPTRDYPYTEQELDQYAEASKCDREQLTKRWIIQRGTQYYIYLAGEYTAPYGQDDIHTATLRDLAPASTAGVSLWTVDASGTMVRKSLSQLMADYGSVATDYLLDMRASRASYDASSRLFIEAPCPLRSLTPVYHPDVASWLEIMAGPSYPALLNWIALVTRLDTPCSALMLTGRKGTGKSLLANGLAKLWSVGGPTPLATAMADFNSAISKCPLVFADEQLPKDWRGHGRTAEIREFIASTSRPYKKKFAHDSVILGAIRLVVAANNEEILAIPDNLSANDIEAIGDRFYHLRVQPEAEEFLTLCNTKDMIGHQIAEHALWLRDNHSVQRQGRFLVKSDDRSFYRALTTKTGIRSSVCQWLVMYLLQPAPVDARRDFLVRVDAGQVLVNAAGVLQDWGTYITNEVVPPTGKLNQALAGLSIGRYHMGRPGKLCSTQYRIVDLEHLFAWADSTEWCNRNQLEEALKVDTVARLDMARSVGQRMATALVKSA